MIAPVIILACILAFLLIGAVFYRLALRRKPSDAKPPKGLAPLHRDFPREWLPQHQTGDICITARDGLTLHARVIECPGSTKFVIACHGYGSQSASMAQYAKIFFDRGYSVLMPDARGHGASAGNTICMGWAERLDVADWARRLEKQYAPDEILLFGVSMGGATVMNAAGEALPDCVRGVIDDCGFVSIRDEFIYQIHSFYHLPAYPLLVPGALICRLLAGYSPLTDGGTCAQLQKSRLPILIIHGEADSFVPAAHGRRAFEAARGPKEIVIVPNAGHAACLRTDPAAYTGAIDRFLAKIHG